MTEIEFDKALETVPDFIMNCPICCGWIEYYGVKKFAMLNFEKSIELKKPMIDIGYCATALMVNNRVEKTVPYSKRMKIC